MNTDILDRLLKYEGKNVMVYTKSGKSHIGRATLKSNWGQTETWNWVVLIGAQEIPVNLEDIEDVREV